MRTSRLLVGLLCVACGGALLAPLLSYPFGRDQGAFACVADVIGRGGIPYRDAWEMKPPGIFYLFWTSFALFGRSMVAPRLLDLLWTLGTAAAIWALGRRLLSTWAGMAGAFLFLIRYVAGHSFWNTAQCEGFASLPLTLAAVALAAAEGKRSKRAAAACGALVALGITLKFTVGIFLALSCAAALASAGEGLRVRAWRAGAYLLGCAAVLGGVAGLMWWAGALRDMIEILFVWNARYAGLKAPGPGLLQEVVQFVIGGRHHGLLFPIGLLALGGAADLLLRREGGRMRWLLPAWALAMIAAVWIQGKYYTYHWLPALPPVALLAGQGLRAAWALLRRVAGPRAAGALYAAGIAGVLAILGGAYWSSLKWPVRYLLGTMPAADFGRAFDGYGGGDFSLRADRELAGFIAQHTPPGAPTFIWGFEPIVYYLADRPPASRFIYQVPLVTEWSPAEWRAELLRDLERTRPACIAVATRDALPWMTGRLDDSAAQLAERPELTEFLERNYPRREVVEDFVVYRRE